MSHRSNLLPPAAAPRFIPDSPARTVTGASAPARDELDAWSRRAAAGNGFGDAALPDIGAATGAAPAPARSSGVGTAVRGVAAHVLAVVRTFVRATIEVRQRRAMRAVLERVDAATLRDLGIDHSELPSFAAEWSGLAQQTRRRVVHSSVGRIRTDGMRINPVDACL